MVFLAVVFGAILFFDVITLVRYLAGKFGKPNQVQTVDE
jgi:hypothetical protein